MDPWVCRISRQASRDEYTEMPSPVGKSSKLKDLKCHQISTTAALPSGHPAFPDYCHIPRQTILYLGSWDCYNFYLILTLNISLWLTIIMWHNSNLVSHLEQKLILSPYGHPWKINGILVISLVDCHSFWLASPTPFLGFFTDSLPLRDIKESSRKQQ